MITYKGIDYETRDLTILIYGETQDITIAPQSLETAMTLELMETEGTEENQIDGEIYFYIADEMLLLSDSDLAANLDEPFVLAGEITPPPHVEGARQVTVIFGDMDFEDDTCLILSVGLKVLVDIDLAQDFAQDIIDEGIYNDFVIPELYTGTIL